MSANSKIEWTDHTFNPWIGCTKVSIAVTGGGGCDHCYAEVSTPARVLRSKGAETWGTDAPRVRTSRANWALPKRWNAQADAFFAQHGRRQRVFCASLADVFDNAAPDEWRNDLFTLLEVTPNLDWLVLTKRIGNVAKMVPARWLEPGGWPAHVRLGITICNQPEADRDISKLLALPSPNFLSMEPLLGPVSLRRWLDVVPPGMPRIFPLAHTVGLSTPLLDWVIVGGESGLGARPMSIQWARELREQCSAAGVPFLFKQWGEWAPARVRQSETPGTFAFGDYKDERTRFVRTEWYPRAFTAFGARCILERVGKKAAGRLLDGREWNEVPT